MIPTSCLVVFGLALDLFGMHSFYLFLAKDHFAAGIYVVCRYWFGSSCRNAYK